MLNFGVFRFPILVVICGNCFFLQVLVDVCDGVGDKLGHSPCYSLVESVVTAAGERVREVCHPAEGGVDISRGKAIPDLRGSSVEIVHQVEACKLGLCVEEPACFDKSAVSVPLLFLYVAAEYLHILVCQIGEALEILDDKLRVALVQRSVVHIDYISRLFEQGTAGEVFQQCDVSAVAVENENLLKAVAVYLLAALLEYLRDQRLREDDRAGIFSGAGLLSEIDGGENDHGLLLRSHRRVVTDVHHVATQRQMYSVRFHTSDGQHAYAVCTLYGIQKFILSKFFPKHKISPCYSFFVVYESKQSGVSRDELLLIRRGSIQRQKHFFDRLLICALAEYIAVIVSENKITENSVEHIEALRNGCAKREFCKRNSEFRVVGADEYRDANL